MDIDPVRLTLGIKYSLFNPPDEFVKLTGVDDAVEIGER